MKKWLFCHYASVIDQELCWEVVCSINDEIIVLNQFHDIFTGNECVVCNDLNIRIHGFHGFLCRFYLRLSNIFGCVDDLPLQVGQIHFIRIDNSDSSYACCRKIHCGRCTKSACTDN